MTKPVMKATELNFYTKGELRNEPVPTFKSSMASSV